jgi:Fe2+ transport system protein FeoA
MAIEREEMTLRRLSTGMTATVTEISGGGDDATRKILSLGIAPGDEVLMLATWPSIVFEVGSTTIALDEELAERILVSPRVN